METRLQPSRSCDEQLVPNQVTEAVVDHLKAVQVKEEYRKQVILQIFGSLHRVTESIHEQDTIRQARQGIGYLAFGNVSLGAGHARDSSVAVPNSNPPAEHPVVAPVLVQHAVFIFVVRGLLFEMRSEVRSYSFNILRMNPAKPFV